VDWQLSYRFPLLTGGFRLNLSGTRLISSTIQPNPGIEPIACGGSFGGPCGATIGGSATPQWKLFNRFAWEKSPVTLTLRHRYFSSTRNGNFAAAEALGLPRIDIPARALRLESRHYFDLAASVSIRRFDLSFGVNNLADQKPSLLGNDQIQANTDPSLYDVLGRRFFVSLRARLH
jgi:outer membrane receptor protein involved in Fe transport